MNTQTTGLPQAAGTTEQNSFVDGQFKAPCFEKDTQSK